MYRMHFLIHPSNDGHLSRFHPLIIMNNAAMNLGHANTCLEFLLSVILGINPDVELLDHMVIQYLIF